MRDIQEIVCNKCVKVEYKTHDGFFGTVDIPTKKGKKRASVCLTVDKTDGETWEHASVAPFDQTTPTWDMMCFIKDLFWQDEEEVIQIHPPKSQYVNVKDNCLHLWRKVGNGNE